MIGASLEVIQEQFERHYRICDQRGTHLHECDCGRALAIHCNCGARLFVSPKNNDTFCEHALAALGRTA